MLKALHQWHLSIDGKGNRESVLWTREKARSYEEISSVHTTYNRYAQKAIKHSFKSTTVKKTRRNQDDAELFQNRIVVCATKSVTPLKLGTLKTGLLKSQTNLDTIVTRNNKVWKYGL